MPKTFFAALLLACCCALSAAAQEHHPHAAHTQESGAADAEVIRRGEPIGDSPRVAFADVVKEPQKYAGRTVVIEGVVSRVCKKEGCWVEIAPDDDAPETVRVTFDHKFSVPKDSDRMKFRAEGQFSVKTLSKEHVEHLVKEDGAKVRTNPDGTADELSFLATGVELRK